MKTYLKLFVALAIATLMFSCGDDDDNNPINDGGWDDILENLMKVDDGKIKIPPVIDPELIDLMPDSFYHVYLIGKGFTNITETGYVYGSSENPTLDNPNSTIKKFEFSDYTKFNNTLEKQKNIALGLYELKPHTTYYVRAYLKHDNKVSYSYNQMKITTHKDDQTGGSVKVY